MQIMKTSHYLKKAGAVCMAAAMMTGCASGSSGANGKTLTVGLNTGFNGIFSPLYYQTVYDDYVIEMVYQSMLSYDRDNQLQPELATEQPTISEDGSTLTFKLKKGVKFSDGSKLDADDVVLTFTAMADPSYTGRFSTYVDYLEGYKEYHEGDAETLSGVEKSTITQLLSTWQHQESMQSAKLVHSQSSLIHNSKNTKKVIQRCLKTRLVNQLVLDHMY